MTDLSKKTLDLEAELIEVCKGRRNHMALIRMLIESMDEGSTQEAINRVSSDDLYSNACSEAYQGEGGKVEWAITVTSGTKGKMYAAAYFGLQTVIDVVREALEDPIFTNVDSSADNVFEYDYTLGRYLTRQEVINKTLNELIRAYNDGEDDYKVMSTSDWWIYVCFPTPSEKGGVRYVP